MILLLCVQRKSKRLDEAEKEKKKVILREVWYKDVCQMASLDI